MEKDTRTINTQTSDDPKTTTAAETTSTPEHTEISTYKTGKTKVITHRGTININIGQDIQIIIGE